MRYSGLKKVSVEDLEEWRKTIWGCRISAALTIEEMAKKLGIPAFRLDKIEKAAQPATEALADLALEISGGDRWDDTEDYTKYLSEK